MSPSQEGPFDVCDFASLFLDHQAVLKCRTRFEGIVFAFVVKAAPYGQLNKIRGSARTCQRPRPRRAAHPIFYAARQQVRL